MKDIAQAQFLKDTDAAIDKFAGRLETICDKDPDFEANLIQRLAKLKTRFSSDPPADEKSVRDALPGLFQSLTAPASIDPTDYTELDTIAFKFELIEDYLAARAESTYPGQDAIHKELMARLGPQSWEQLQRARHLLLELKQGILPADVAEAIRNNTSDLAIEASPAATQPNVPVRFRVRFYGRDDLTNSAAAERIKCFWDFGDSRRAQGWEVDHFYRRAPRTNPLARWFGRTHKVTVNFVDVEGKRIDEPDNSLTPRTISRNVTVKPRIIWLAPRTRLEMVWLFAGLAIPFFSLLTGARDQFLKSDALTGIVTIFLLGFGADHVKNLFKKAS